MATATHGKRAGRKQKHHVMEDGTPIPGLSRRPSDGRWRIIGTQTTFSAPDERAAVEKFRRLTERKGGMTSAERWQRSAMFTADGMGTIVGRILSAEDPEAEFWAVMADELYSQPKLCAERTGIEWLSYGPRLDPPTPLPSLDQLEKEWEQHAECSALQMKKVLRAWRDFRETAGVAGLDDITGGTVIAYKDAVKKRGLSKKQEHHLFSGVRRLLRFAQQDRALAVEPIEKILTNLKPLKVKKERTTPDPKPLPVADFHKMLKAAQDEEDRALLMLMLNGAFYIKEVIRLEWSDLKHEDGTPGGDAVIVTNREKTGNVIRVCTLWEETRAALRKLPRHGPLLFYNYRAEPLQVSGAQRRWQRMALAAGLARKTGPKSIKCDVTASQLRDGAYTAAVAAKVPFQFCQLLAGHATGIADHYVQRQPTMVKDACDAVRAKYFGGRQ